MSKRQWDLAILLGLTLGALVTRSYGISEWPFVQDEYFTVVFAEPRATKLVNPAYYNLVLASFSLFGVSEWSARLPTLILGILSVPVYYLTWRSVLGRSVALIGSLLILFSSWHLWHSQYARFYTGVFLFGSLSYFFYYQAIRLNSIKNLLWAMLAAVTAVLFHLTAVMVPAACALFSAIVLLSKRATDSGYSKRIAAIQLALCAALGLLASGVLFSVLAGWSSGSRPRGGSLSMVSLMAPLKAPLLLLRDFQVPVGISAFFGLIFLLKEDFFKALFFGVGAGLPILTLSTCAALMPIRGDYMFYTAPLVFALSAYACHYVGKALPYPRIASQVLAVIVIASLMPNMITHYMDKATLDVREAVAFVEKNHRPGDRIVPRVSGFNYYLGDNYPIEPPMGNPYTGKMRSPVGGPAVDSKWSQKLQAYKDAGHRVWIVLPAKRKPLFKDVETWLMGNATLVWRKYSKRYDTKVRGLEIFLVNGNQDDLAEN